MNSLQLVLQVTTALIQWDLGLLCSNKMLRP